MNFETNDFEMEMLEIQEYEQQLQETELRLQEYKQRLLEAQAREHQMSNEQAREFLENYGDIGIIGGEDEFIDPHSADDSEETTEMTTAEEAPKNAKEMSVADAGITAIFGYAVVFFGLVILMVVLYCTGAIFKKRDEKAKAAKESATETAAKNVPAVPAVNKPVAPGSAGHVKLFDVPDKEAAMIMAIVADKMQKPLNELHFISIKEVK